MVCMQAEAVLYHGEDMGQVLEAAVFISCKEVLLFTPDQIHRNCVRVTTFYPTDAIRKEDQKRLE